MHFTCMMKKKLFTQYPAAAYLAVYLHYCLQKLKIDMIDISTSDKL